MQQPLAECAMLDEARVGTAMLTLQLRAAVQEAVQAEASFGDRDTARDDLRGRLAVLVDRRRTDLAVQLTTARQEAVRLVEDARQRAAVIAEASALMANAEPEPMVVAEPVSAPGLIGRAREALLALQLRTALQESVEAERDEVVSRKAWDEWQRQTLRVEDRRREFDNEITLARAEAEVQIRAAHSEAAALLTGAESAEIDVDVVWADAPTPEALPTAPPVTTPVNVVIDAEAFARVFATVFSTMFDERAAAWRGSVQPQPYPTQMYSVGQFALPQPALMPVKQSFWSHAKHVDVLLLSAAMVIVLVVLAAWLV